MRLSIKCWNMRKIWDGGNVNITSWELIPNDSVNGMKFGMERSEIRKLLGKPEKVFRKTSAAVNTTDAYADFHVYYSAEDRMEAIEFFNGNINLYIKLQRLLPGTLNEARSLFPDLTGSDEFYTSKASSVAICLEADKIVSVLVGRKDYYK